LRKNQKLQCNDCYEIDKQWHRKIIGGLQIETKCLLHLFSVFINTLTPSIMNTSTHPSDVSKTKLPGDEIISLPEVANGSYIISVEEMNGEHIESIRLNVFR
jgi:hypothetical protein